MGPFPANASPKDNEILQFLYDHVTDPNNKHVINDLTVGTRSTDGDKVSVPVTAKETSVEYTSSVDVTYEVTDKIPLDDVFDEHGKDLYDATNSLWLSKPSSRDVVNRVKELNPLININALDVDRATFGYSNGKYTVNVIPASWSSLYEGTVTVQWSPGLNVNIDPWSTGNNVDYGYSTAPTAPLSINKTLSTGTVTYKFDNDDTTSADGRFTIINNSTLQFNTGADASDVPHQCSIKAVVSGNTSYVGETQTTQASITVNYNNDWKDIYDVNDFTDSEFSVSGSGFWGTGEDTNHMRNRIWYNESVGLIRINFTNVCPTKTSSTPLVLFKWLKSKYTVQSIYLSSLLVGGSGNGAGRDDLNPVLDNTDSTHQSLLIGPNMKSTSDNICGYVLLNVKATPPALNWEDKTISYNPQKFTTTNNIICKYNSKAGLIHLVGNGLQVTADLNGDQYLFTMDNTILKWNHMWQNGAVTKTPISGGQSYNANLLWVNIGGATYNWNIYSGWTSGFRAWTQGYEYSFDIMLCTRSYE